MNNERDDSFQTVVYKGAMVCVPFQIHLNGRREVELLVNGEKQSFEEQLMMNFKRVIVIKYENSSKYSVMLHSGISMTVEGHKDLLQVMVMLPVEYKGKGKVLPMRHSWFT